MQKRDILIQNIVLVEAPHFFKYILMIVCICALKKQTALQKHNIGGGRVIKQLQILIVRINADLRAVDHAQI